MLANVRVVVGVHKSHWSKQTLNQARHVHVYDRHWSVENRRQVGCGDVGPDSGQRYQFFFGVLWFAVSLEKLLRNLPEGVGPLAL